MRNIYLPLLLAVSLGLLLTGCNFGAPAGPTETSTLSSDDVLQTAEAIAEATRGAASPTPTREPITATPTQVPETNTPEPTGTSSSPMVTADYNANVRSGPDEVFESIDYLLQGDQAQAVGRFINEENGTWWFIERVGEGRDGWIWGGAVTFSGNENSVPILESPPTPTPGPSPTPTDAS
ncbi:MAG: SH3 domain-containing protein [Anaerolineales bacterium]